MLLFILGPTLMQEQTVQSSQQQNGEAAVQVQSVNGPSTIKVTVNKLHITCIAQDSHSAASRVGKRQILLFYRSTVSSIASR